ncbi:MAG: nucleotide exchange factor GrpE [Candidatus Gracilibacteria bacterium]|nr:nucleotide exchange factor GrpE [Candidatus Gracilibacteria bacterium]MDD3119896.1 nucleotide exchange factor GrpE [Candidatus Gracilibacteria bacterium]MDD4530067.1 nucleotide exchange factor GrpE [Candidatus Gracilibacteria bacterium]
MTEKKHEQEEDQKLDTSGQNNNGSGQNEIEELKKEIETLKESLARSQADYSNLIRRSEKEKDETKIYIVTKVVNKILPFIDNLERAKELIPEELKDNSRVNGIDGIYLAVLKQLESLEIKPFESLGQELDVNLHEVLMQGPGKEGIIVKEIERGYKLGEKVLRLAKVIVGNGEE